MPHLTLWPQLTCRREGRLMSWATLDRMSVCLHAFYQIRGSWGTWTLSNSSPLSGAWCMGLLLDSCEWLNKQAGYWRAQELYSRAHCCVGCLTSYRKCHKQESLFPLQQKVESQKSSTKQATLPKALRKTLPLSFLAVSSCWHAWFIAIPIQFQPPLVCGLPTSNYLLVSKPLFSQTHH